MTTATFSKDAWYAVAAVDAVGPGEVMPATLFGTERVLWRDADGEAHVWDNRCIHRGMRLSFGFVDGDRLCCRYHGWAFGPDSQCVRIPAHPDMTPPGDFRIPAAPSVEAGGLVWTTLDDAAEFPGVSALDGLVFCRTVAFAADAAAVAAILDDAEFALPGGGAPDGFDRSLEPGGITVIRASGENGVTLAVALQPVGPGTCQAHVFAGPVSGDAAALRRHFARWAQRLRLQVAAGQEAAA